MYFGGLQLSFWSDQIVGIGADIPLGKMNRSFVAISLVLFFVSRASAFCCGTSGNIQYFPSPTQSCDVAGPDGASYPGTAYYAVTGSCTCPGSFDSDDAVLCGSTSYDASAPSVVPDFSNQVAIAAGYCTQNAQVSADPSYVFCVAGVGGDPHMTGFDGTRFEFHGVHGGVFNLISEEGLQLNMALDNLGQTDATYIRALGLKVGQEAKVKVATTANATGSLLLSLNGAQVQFPRSSSVIVNKMKAGSAEVIYGIADHGEEFVRVKTAALDMTVKRNLGAAHLDADFSVLRDVPMHGVLGQTLKWMHSPGSKFEGDEADYLVSELFADDFKFNLYQGAESENRRLLRAAPAISVSAHVGKF